MLYQYGYSVDSLMYVVENSDGGRRIGSREQVFRGPGMIRDEAVIGR